MNRFHFPWGAVLGPLLTLLATGAPGLHADTVAQPRRSYGLGELRTLALSPDANRLATAGTSGAFLWDLPTGTVLHQLLDHASPVTALAFSPDGRTLLTGARDGSVRAWEVATGMPLGVYTGHRQEIQALAFSPDGLVFVSASGDNHALVRSTDSGQVRQDFHRPGWFINAAVFTPDGRHVVTADGSFTNNLSLWNLATGERVRAFGGTAGQARALAFLPDGRLATGGEDPSVRIWNLETGQAEQSLTGLTGTVCALVPDPNSTTLLAGSFDGLLLTWDVATGTILQQARRASASAIHSLPGSPRVALATVDHTVELVDADTSVTEATLVGHTTSTFSAVAVSPDGRTVVAGGVETLTRMWNRTNTAPLRSFPGTRAGTATAMFSRDGSRLLTTTVSPQKAARIWNAATGGIERELLGHTGFLTAAAFSPDGTRVVTGALDNTVRLWNPDTGVMLRSFAATPGGVTSVALSPDASLVAGGGGAFDPTVQLWVAQTGQRLHSWTVDAGSVRALAFHPSQRLLLVGWEGGVIRLFQLDSGEMEREWTVPAAFLDAAVFSPDGRFVLTGDNFPEFAARLWDAETGELVRTFAGGTAPVTAVAFNPAGTEILTGSDRVRLWDIRDLVARLRLEHLPGTLRLHWANGTLETADQASGPWQPLPQAVSPWSIDTTRPSGFFRVRAPDAD